MRIPRRRVLARAAAAGCIRPLQRPIGIGGVFRVILRKEQAVPFLSGVLLLRAAAGRTSCV